MPTRVLYIESAPQAGGSTVSLYELLRGLDRQAVEPVVLLCASNPFREHIAALGIRVLVSSAYCSQRTPAYPPALAQARASTWATRLRSNRLTQGMWKASGLAVRTLLHTLPLARQVQRIIGQGRIALVHLNDASELHKAGIIASRLAGVPCVCHVRSMPPLDALDRFLSRWVSHFVFISHAVEQDQRQKGLGQRPGTVIYNAVDLAPYQALDRGTARRSFELAASDRVVGIMARLEPWKGHRDLLAALALSAPQVPGLRCLIAGAPASDGAWYQDELAETTRSLALEDVVRFVGFQADAPRFLSALDLLVHTSVQPEPFGRALIEGMAAGLPVVATATGGVAEIVVDEQTGLLVPPGQPAALAAAMLRLLSDPVLARRMGDQGQERVSTVFAIQSHMAAIESIYQLVTQRKV